MSTDREAYLTSHLGKARTTISRAMHQTDQIKLRLDLVAQALTRGDGRAPLAAERARDAVQDLRIMLSDMEVYVTLHEKKESD